MKKTRPRQINLNLKVLGYVRDNVWAAHCLEMDLVGEGRTFEQAFRNLEDLVEMQVSFAFYKDDFTLLYHPAPTELFAVFANLARDAFLSPYNPPEYDDSAFAYLPMPPKPKKTQREFTPVGV
jgi:hypothetical protein